MHADDALRMTQICSHVRDRQRGRVRGQDAVFGDDLLELGEHPLLELELLEDGLEDEVAIVEALVIDAARGKCREKASLALVVPSFLDLTFELGAKVAEGVVDDLLLYVADDDRELEPAQTQECDLPRHQPCADNSDLGDLPGSGGRTCGMLLGASVDKVEGIDRRLRLRPWEKLADCLFLPAVALGDGPLSRALDQIERDIRGRRGAVNRVVDRRPGAPEDQLGIGPVGLSPLQTLLDQLACKRERVVDELRGLEQSIGDAELRYVSAQEHPVLAQRVRHDHLDCDFGPDQLRQQLCPSPGGEKTEEHFGKGDVAAFPFRHPSLYSPPFSGGGRPCRSPKRIR